MYRCRRMGNIRCAVPLIKLPFTRLPERNGVKTVRITRRQGDLPESLTVRTEEPRKVTICKGQGDDTIIRTIEK